MLSIIKQDWRLLMFGFWMMFWSSPGQTYFIALFGGAIRDEFSLSHGEFGAVYSAGTLLSALVIIWSGRFIDKVDLKKYSLLLINLLAATCIFISFANGVVMLFFAMFMLRQIGQGLITHSGSTSMVRYFHGARGRASAIASFGFAASQATLPVVVVAVITVYGWRDAWRVTAVLLLIIMIPAVWFLLKNHSKRHEEHLSSLHKSLDKNDPAAEQQWTRQQVLRDKRFYLAMPAYLAPAFFFTGYFFHQVYIVEIKGWELDWWSKALAVYAGAALISTIVTGPWVDKIGARKLFPLFSLPLAVALLYLTFSDSTTAGFAFLIFTGFTTGWVPTVMGPFWAEMYGVTHIGAIKALGTSLMVFASALSPVMLGWLFDAGIALETTTLFSAVYIVFACAIAWLVFGRASR